MSKIPKFKILDGSVPTEVGKSKPDEPFNSHQLNFTDIPSGNHDDSCEDCAFRKQDSLYRGINQRLSARKGDILTDDELYNMGKSVRSGIPLDNYQQTPPTQNTFQNNTVQLPVPQYQPPQPSYYRPPYQPTVSLPPPTPQPSCNMIINHVKACPLCSNFTTSNQKLIMMIAGFLLILCILLLILYLKK